MKTNCQRADGKCSQCGELVGARTIRICPAGPHGNLITEVPIRDQSREKLGDWVERKLKSVGITQERIADALDAVGMPGDGCDGCKKRKEWLNRMSDWWNEQ